MTWAKEDQTRLSAPRKGSASVDMSTPANPNTDTEAQKGSLAPIAHCRWPGPSENGGYHVCGKIPE